MHGATQQNITYQEMLGRLSLFSLQSWVCWVCCGGIRDVHATQVLKSSQWLFVSSFTCKFNCSAADTLC